METPLESLQYPVGRFDWPEHVTYAEITSAMNIISVFPEKITEAIRGLNDEQLNTLYRPDGWSIRQVVHHCADSHMNAYMRFKLALTEHNPMIKPYDQARWAQLPDSRLEPRISLYIIDGIHSRWVNLMEQMTDADWDKTYIHPEYNKQFNLRQVVMNYEWHCRHHLQHILDCRKRNQF